MGHFACTADTIDKLHLLHLEFNKEFFPSRQQEADFWESDAGRTLMQA